MFKEIRLAIQSVLLTSTKVQKVYLTDRTRFEGFPVAVITPSENETDYGSTCKDRRVFVFKVKVYYPITSEDKQEVEELAFQDVVDELIVLFNKRALLDPVVDWVEPIPSAWSYEERGEGLYRMAEIGLRCVKYVSAGL